MKVILILVMLSNHFIVDEERSEQDPQEDIGKNMVLDGILWYFRTLLKKV